VVHMEKDLASTNTRKNSVGDIYSENCGTLGKRLSECQELCRRYLFRKLWFPPSVFLLTLGNLGYRVSFSNQSDT
jgi:hypothetical protein